MKNLKNLLDMLREFYYEKNGKKETLEFLKYMIVELENTRARDWEKILEEIDE